MWACCSNFPGAGNPISETSSHLTLSSSGESCKLSVRQRLIGDLSAPIPPNLAPPFPADDTAISAKTWWCRKLWRGEYSLAQSFWGFFILGTLVGMIVGVNPAFLFLPGASLAFPLVFLGYQISAGVGVWRSANAFLARSGGYGSIRYADSVKAIAAKTVVALLIVILSILFLRAVSMLASYSRA